MDLSKYRNKLVGSEEERAVSPVIGVILMVAITVILAAVIAAFVLDMGDSMGSGPTNAAVSADVSDSENTTTLTVDEMGDAEHFELRGFDEDNIDSGVNESPHRFEDNLTATGDSVTLKLNESRDAGSANIVAVNGDSESVIGDFEWEAGN
ncbi:type IV pilin [Haloterrigena salifodinae]|uniref:Type IV pilin N-terminal domain-containing protein n=1 Tax=Haloterrigena salifodinae TaxID=2675099 RepID=A0A8T8DYV9_9EURY|nr:type IV pilin N-terminal domain-containing protein [Haloterrigena salifodinae]QRV14715.1 type IV pilin N-terminal domain-containing protein [Haloterrigena salifodinae]